VTPFVELLEFEVSHIPETMARCLFITPLRYFIFLTRFIKWKAISLFTCVITKHTYFRPDFAASRREKFAARYFWFEAKLKQKKFIFTWYSVTSGWDSKIGPFYFLAEIIGRFLGAGPLN